MGLKKAASHEGLREVIEREHVRDLDGLLAQLRSGDVEQRRWAARDLVAHPAAVAALGSQLLAERESSVRQTLFTALASYADEASVTALLPLLRSEDAELRNGAIEALAAMPRAVAPRIDALLRDGDADVRIFTVNLLGELRHERVRPWMLAVLRDDREVNVVAAALEVLAEVGAPEDCAALESVRQRFAADAFIGFAVDMALERIQAA